MSVSQEKNTNPSREPTYNEETGRYSIEHDGSTDLSVLIVSAISSITDTDPMDIDPPLNEAIDPDALDRLFSDRPGGLPREGGYLAFYLGDCRVTVYSDGELVIDPQ